MKNIFISSTFRDMHAERDLVQERVLPVLRAEARKYGDNVEAIDLRWGVDTSTLETDEGSAKILTVCLDEIERSHPYMLIFLGERYGWIPKGELIEKAVKSRGDKYITEDFEKSVTALEIEYGALSEKYGDIKHCVVCFRESVTESMDAETKSIYAEQEEKGIQKLKELKDRIRKDLGEDGYLITYTGTWDESAHTLTDLRVGRQPLEEVLTRCYIEIFQQNWKDYEQLSWQEKEQLGFKALMESKLRSFVGREELLDKYHEMAVNDTGALVLQGEVGSGKTSIMCKLIEKLQKEGKKVFYFFSGAGSMSTSAQLLVQQMLYYVEEQLGIEEHWEEETEEEVSKLESLSEIQEKKSKYDVCLERLREFCSMLQEKIYFCIDALDQLFMDEHVEKLDFMIKNEKVQMILSCTDTFVLSSVILLEIQKEYVPPLNIEDAKAVVEGILKSNSRDVYEEMEQEILKKKNVGSPPYISFLIQRLNMMDQDELEQLNSGEEDKIDFTHKVIRQGLLMEIKNPNSYEEEIKEYIKSLDLEDSFRIQEGMYYARIMEDYGLAGEIIRQTYDSESKLLLRMVKKEAVEDEGNFYCQLLQREGIRQGKIRDFFRMKLRNEFESSQKEMGIKKRIISELIDCSHKLFGSQRSASSLYELLLCYFCMKEVLVESGCLEEALIYCEHELQCAEKLYASKKSESIVGTLLLLIPAWQYRRSRRICRPCTQVTRKFRIGLKNCVRKKTYNRRNKE